VDQVALAKFFFPALQLSLVSVIPPMVHTHPFIQRRRYVTLAVDSVFKQHISKTHISLGILR